MKRVLVIITTAFVRYGGLSNSYLNYYREMDKKKFSIDFASTNHIDSWLEDEVKANGGLYHYLGNRKKNPIAYYNRLAKLLKKYNYNIVHIHGNSSTMVIETLVCHMSNIEKIIVQVHAVESDYRLLDLMLRPIFNHTYNVAISVSKLAGDRLYRGEFKVLNNAIDLVKFRYNDQVRRRLRHDLGLDDCFVIGNVGKLTKLKNQNF